ncbi:MAG: FecR domain-containing protein [Cyclobacteriaceae bacterium]|nr:FecR domain-containing protein [Cyclobacteriaceae bacterium]
MTRSRSNYLINRLLANDLTAAELEELLKGLEDQDYIYEYSDVLEKQFERLIDEHAPIDPAVLGAWRNKNTAKEKSQSLIEKRSRRAPDLRGLAAGIVIFISLGLASYFIYSQVESDNSGQLAETVIPVVTHRQELAPLGRRKTVKLQDGSYVKLNAGSKIQYPVTFNGDDRSVEINGEAFFDVARDESRPFLIHVSDVLIKVLGTSFNVKYFEEDKELSITVSSGSVGVEMPLVQNKPVVLTKDQKLIFDISSGSTNILDVVADEDISWIKGLLRFDRTPFVKVKGMLERWYDVEIQITNEKLYNASLTGKHLNESLISVLESISYALGAEYEIKGRTIILK